MGVADWTAAAVSVKNWQSRLNGFGYSLAVDGIAGPKTYSALFAYMGAKDTAAAFGQASAADFIKYGITTPLRLAHFLAQAAHETMGFRYLKELWGPTDAQKGYEGRADLGNTLPGDGFRFRGRGIFQITGRDNYRRYGDRTGADLIDHPDAAADPSLALLIACLYWTDHKLNDYADADDILGVSNGINRGNPASIREPNGYADRKAQLAKAKRVLV
jgi:putative chitinase